MTSHGIDAGDGLPLTIPRLLRERAAQRGDAPLLVVDDARLGYAEADRRSATLARALLAAGAGPGTRVAILHPNGPEFAVAFLAATRIGAIAVPLSTFSTRSELVSLLRRADVAFLLASARHRANDFGASLRDGLDAFDPDRTPPLFSPAAPSLRRIAFDLEGDSAFDPGWTLSGLLAGASRVGEDVLRAAEAQVRPADPLVIVHTSGTTSEPKGVVHTHGALIRHQDNLNEMRRYAPPEVLFSSSPFFWIGGLAYGLLGTLVAGARLVCSNAPTAAGVLDVLERERPTMVNGFAASVAHLASDPSFAGRDLSSIRRGNLWPLLPADVRPADTERRHAMLGMTEAGSVCLADPDEGEQPEHRRGSFGRAVPGFETRVVAVEADRDCAPGEVGELCLRGPFLMQGYDGRERHATFDREGWFHTGDLVSRDAAGYFYFRGRRGEMIKAAGANVSPREVEAAILEAAGLVAHVVGIDDAVRGQIVAALIRDPGDGREVDVEALRRALRERLSAYKVPGRFRVVPAEAVPMTSSGKPDLRALKELLRG